MISRKRGHLPIDFSCAFFDYDRQSAAPTELRRARMSKPRLDGSQRPELARLQTAPPSKGIEYEVVPVDPNASFYLAEFQWKYFPYFWHYHPEIELGLVIQGRGMRIVGDSIEHFEEGDLCLLGGNLPHCWVSDRKRQKKLARSAVIQFRADFLGDRFFTAPELRHIRDMLTRARCGFRIEGATRKAVTERMLLMLRLPLGRWEQISHLLWILGTLAESKECVPLATGRAEPETDRHDRQKINQVLALTNVTPGELPSQKVVAEAVRLSPAAFSRFFRKHLGKTYVDYVIDLRVAHVCRQLINTEAGITEIAYASGFESLSNFNRQFSKRKGCSPGAWREMALRER